MQPHKISIPLPSRPSDYVPGTGPPLRRITLQPPTDSTAYIDDRILLPPVGNAADGRALPKRMKYVVGWRDLPAARLLVSAMDILDYVSPYTLEEWEYKMELELDVERARLDAQRKATRAATRALPQDAAEGVEPPPQTKEKKRGRPPVHTEIEAAVVAEAEDEHGKKRGGAMSLSTPKKRKMDDFVDGYTSDESPSEQLLLDFERSSGQAGLSIRPAVELKLESRLEPNLEPNLEPKLELNQSPVASIASIAAISPMAPMAPLAPVAPLAMMDMDDNNNDSDDQDIVADRYRGVKPQYLKKPRPQTRIMLPPLSSASSTPQPKSERSASPVVSFTRVAAPPTTGPVKKFVQGRPVGAGMRPITDCMSPKARSISSNSSTQQMLPAQNKPSTTPPKLRLSAQAPMNQSASLVEPKAKQMRQKPQLQMSSPPLPQQQPSSAQEQTRGSSMPTIPVDTQPTPQPAEQPINRIRPPLVDVQSPPSQQPQEEPKKIVLPSFKRRAAQPPAQRKAAQAEARRLERADDRRRSPRREQEQEQEQRVLPAAYNTRSPTPPLRRPPLMLPRMIQPAIDGPPAPPPQQESISIINPDVKKRRSQSPSLPSPPLQRLEQAAPRKRVKPSVDQPFPLPWPPEQQRQEQINKPAQVAKKPRPLLRKRPPLSLQQHRQEPINEKAPVASRARPPSPAPQRGIKPSTVDKGPPPRPPQQQKPQQDPKNKRIQIAANNTNNTNNNNNKRHRQLSPPSQPRRKRTKKNKDPVFASSSESDSDDDPFVPASERDWNVERLEGVRLYDIEGRGRVRYFKVRWEGTWPPEQNPTWEPEENIPDELVREFCKTFDNTQQQSLQQSPKKKKREQKTKKSSSNGSRSSSRRTERQSTHSSRRGNIEEEKEKDDGLPTLRLSLEHVVEVEGREKGMSSPWTSESGLYVYSGDHDVDKKSWDVPNEDGYSAN